MKLRKPRPRPKRLYIVCPHVRILADVRHCKLYDDTPGMGKRQRWGEVTCGRSQGRDDIEECSLVEEAVLREKLPGLLPQ